MGILATYKKDLMPANTFGSADILAMFVIGWLVGVGYMALFSKGNE